MSNKRKKTPYKPKSFESMGVKFTDPNGTIRADTSANVYESLVLSKAYRDLIARQRELYRLCKHQYYGHRKPKADFKDIEHLQDDNLFYMNWGNVKPYELYKPSDSSTFYKDMKVLVSHGLIEKVSRIPNGKAIYRYSDKWQTWKKE